MNKVNIKNVLILPAALGAAVAAHWYSALRHGLWMDEFGTYWVIRDGWQDAIARCLSRFHQSPFYYLVAWLNGQAFGTSETALRVPSVVAILATVYFVYKIGAELFDRPTGAFAAVFFMTMEDTFFCATSARPYAFGLFFSAASFYFLLRWTRHGSFAQWILYILSTLALFHCQWIFGALLAVHVVYFILEPEKSTRATPRNYFLALCSVALLWAPIIPQFLSLWGARSQLSYLAPVSSDRFWRTIFSLLPLTPLAIFFFCWSTLSAAAWQKQGNELDRWIGVVAASVSIYAYPALVFALPLQSFILWALSKSAETDRSQDHARDLLIIAVLSAPAFVPLLYAGPDWGTRLAKLFMLNVPANGVNPIDANRFPGLLLAVALVLLLQRKTSFDWKEIRRLAAFSFWYLFPPLLVFLVSSHSNAKIFYSRYFIYWGIGAALGVAGFVRHVPHKNLRWILLGLIDVFAFLNQRLDPPYYQQQNWAGASRTVNDWVEDGDTPVLFLSGYIESKQTKWLTVPDLKEILLVPCQYYPVRGSVTLIPFSPYFPATKNYLDSVIARLVEQKRDFVLYKGGGDSRTIDWFREELLGKGFRLEKQRGTGPISVAYFRYTH